MNIWTILAVVGVILFGLGLLLSIINGIYYFFAKEGRTFFWARWKHKAINFKFYPGGIVKMEIVDPKKPYTEDDFGAYTYDDFRREYRLNGVPIYLTWVYKAVNFPPEVIKEVQKAKQAGILTQDDLRMLFAQALKRAQEEAEKTGKAYAPVVYGSNFKVLHVKPKWKKSKKGELLDEVEVTIEVEEPINVEMIEHFWARRFSARAFKKIVESIRIEMMQKIREEFRKKTEGMSVGKGTFAILIAIGIVIFLVYWYVMKKPPSTNPVKAIPPGIGVGG